MSEETTKCPVKHQKGSPEAEGESSWSKLWRPFTASPAASAGVNSSSPTPINGNQSSDRSCSAPSPASLEEAARYAQTPQADQKVRLDTSRQISSIPRGDHANQEMPHHQLHETGANWTYPSEQQLYNAMRRKGWDKIPEETIPTVLQIHNGINERTWSQIQKWEDAEDIQLSKFQGRPRDMTPKAFLFSSILRLYDPPFDRHDWYVQHQSGFQQRYVIDYYYLPPSDPSLPPIPFVDARPALDHPRAVFMRGAAIPRRSISWYLNLCSAIPATEGGVDLAPSRRYEL